MVVRDSVPENKKPLGLLYVPDIGTMYWYRLIVALPLV